MDTKISESEKNGINKIPGKIILFLTRNFDDKLIANEAKVSHSLSITNFFILGGADSSCLRNINNPEGLKSDNIGSFWDSFRDKFKKSNTVVHKNFDGNLRRLEINGSKTGIFFYHHWFDQQLSHKNTDIIKYFVKAILEDIKTCLNCKIIKEMHLIMHHGDFIDGDVGKLTPDEIKLHIKKIVENVTIYSFHHQRGYLVYDKVLNNIDIYKQLCDGVNNIYTIEDYVLSLFDPEVINNSFENLLNQ